MNKLNKVIVKFVFEYDYTDLANQAIEDNQFEDQEDLEFSLKDWILEDVQEEIVNNFDCKNIEIHIE